MQCRQALRKHAITSAAIAHSNGPSEALWITDELLNQAFARFVRVSNAGKRHGSTIPGPLEAQRRHSRRRMGLMTADNGQFGSLAEFGALYGAVPYASSEAYSYLPPSPRALTRQATLPNLFSTSYKLSEPPRQEIPIKKDLIEEVAPQRINQLLPKIRAGARITAAKLQPILQRLEANEARTILADLEDLRTVLKKNQLSAKAFDVLFGVFVAQHSLGKLSTSNLLRISDVLFKFSRERGNAHIETWQILTSKFRITILRDDAMARSFASLFSQHPTTTLGDHKRYEWHVGRLQLVSKVLAQYAKASVSCELYVKHVSKLLFWLIKGALKAELSNAEKKAFVIAVAEVLRERNTTDVLKATTSLFLAGSHETINLWLRCARASGAFHRSLAEEKLFSNLSIYHDIGKHYTPDQLSIYLDSLSYRDLGVLLFMAWGMPRSSQPENVHHGLDSLEKDTAATTPTALSQPFVTEVRVAIKNIYSTGVLPNLQTAELLSSYVAGSHDVEALRRNIADSKDKNLGTQALLNYYRALCKATSSSNVLQQEAIAHLLNIDKPRLALRLFCASPGVFVKDVSGLVNHLLRVWPDTGQILHLISRNLALRSDHRALMRRRTSTSMRRIPPDNVVDLVSQLGVHTAFSTHFHARTTWDRAFLCYRFLSDRGIDVSKPSELAKRRSKAYFYAGVVRPLRDGDRLPNARLRYILQTVQDSESPETVLALKQLVVSERARQEVRPPAIELEGWLNQGRRYRNIQRRQRSLKFAAPDRSCNSSL